MKAFASIDIKYVTLVAAVAELLTILTSWILCSYVHKECPALPHLPTISDTWVYPAGSYISRWVTAIVCMVMGSAQWVIYAINTGILGFEPRIKSRTLAIVTSVVGFVSCVLLSWVAAICDNDSAPTCRGNGTIHDITAVLFFIGYNFMMAMSSFSKSEALSLHHVMVLVSTLAKCRFVAPSVLNAITNVGDQTPLAIIEWTDVAVILIWTVSFLISNSPKVRVGLCDVSSERTSSIKASLLVDNPKASISSSAAPLTVAFFSMETLSAISIVWFFVALFVSLGFFVLQGRLDGHVPYISDTWVYPPGDWISRNLVMGGAVCTAIVHVLFYFVDGNAASVSGQSASRTALALLACLGVSIVGCVDESENGTIHVIGATMFFASYDLFMVWTAASRMGLDTARLFGTTLCAVSLATKARFLGFDLGDSVPEILEWTDAFAIIGFFMYDVHFHGDALSTVGVYIYRDEVPPVVGP